MRKFSVPIPIVLISLFYIGVTAFKLYTILFWEELASASFGYWLERVFIVTGIIIGLGLPRKSRVAYISLITEALLIFFSGTFLLVLLFFNFLPFGGEFVYFQVYILGTIVLYFFIYRYMRSAKIKTLYFPH